VVVRSVGCVRSLAHLPYMRCNNYRTERCISEIILSSNIDYFAILIVFSSIGFVDHMHFICLFRLLRSCIIFGNEMKVIKVVSKLLKKKEKKK
jgi:hypothetical protein